MRLDGWLRFRIYSDFRRTLGIYTRNRTVVETFTRTNGGLEKQITIALKSLMSAGAPKNITPKAQT